jgi:hypothetical protein
LLHVPGMSTMSDNLWAFKATSRFANSQPQGAKSGRYGKQSSFPTNFVAKNSYTTALRPEKTCVSWTQVKTTLTWFLLQGTWLSELRPVNQHHYFETRARLQVAERRHDACILHHDKASDHDTIALPKFWIKKLTMKIKTPTKLCHVCDHVTFGYSKDSRLLWKSRDIQRLWMFRVMQWPSKHKKSCSNDLHRGNTN